MKMDLHTNQTSTALLRTSDGVDTLETNSLCCAAAGIIAPLRATAEALIPHEKLRGAALADATLNAQERPPAQPAVGYTHISSYAAALRRYWVLPEVVAAIIRDICEAKPSDGSDSITIAVAELELILQQNLEATHNRIAAMEQEQHQPQQIAADERKAGIDELVKVLNPYQGARLSISQSAEALYDSGYRRKKADSQEISQ